VTEPEIPSQTPDSRPEGSSPDEPGTSPVAVGPWRRRSRTTAYANPWVEVVHDEVDRPDGSPGIYGVVRFRNVAVGVVAVDEAGRILLVGQHRYTLDRYSWEIPEGGAPMDEDPELGARRELAEETGYTADAWRVLCRFSLSNSITDEVGVIYLATGLREGTASPEPSEELAIRWATPDAVLAEIDAGEIHDIMTIAGVTRYLLEGGWPRMGGGREPLSRTP
jgi:8-oxo-dGTP pyrophosphatase MutT (NUDIX family)